MVEGGDGKDAERFVGSWRLASLESAGRTVQRSGGTATDGLIIYAPDGYMSAQIVSPGDSDGPGDYHAYFGPYSVDEAASTVTHHRIANNHPGNPADVVRHYTFLADDVLMLTPLNLEGVRLTFHRAGR